jgi:hypothetical protein
MRFLIVMCFLNVGCRGEEFSTASNSVQVLPEAGVW